MNIRSSTQLSALARLFSTSVFREMAKRSQSGLFRRLLAQTNLIRQIDLCKTVGDAFDAAFNILNNVGTRNEYVYRAAIIQQILLEKHSLLNASVLNEFRVGRCKADLVILNGTTTAYEIKSERDSLTRLVTQIENYKKIFAAVNVITSECHKEKVLNMLPHDVGVMLLSDGYQISSVREAENCPARICPVMVFESLRLAEGIAILQSMDVTVPDVPNTQKHAALRDIFAKLNPVDLHAEMVRTLRQTRNLAPLSDYINRLPNSLKAAALSIPVNHSGHSRLISAITTPLHAAMNWN